MCEQWWKEERAGAEFLMPQLLPYLVARSLEDDARYEAGGVALVVVAVVNVVVVEVVVVQVVIALVEEQVGAGAGGGEG